MATNRYDEAIRLFVETSGDKELGQLLTTLTKLGQSADVSAEQAQQLVAELDKLASTSNNIRQYTALKGAIADTGEAIEKAKLKLAGLGSEFDKAEKPTKAMEKSLARAAKEVETLSKQQNRQQAELTRTTNALRAAGVDTNKLGDAYSKLQGDFAGFTARATTAAAAMQTTAKQGKAAAGSVTRLGASAATSSKSLAEIATRLTLVSGAATAALQGLAAITGATLFTGAIRSASTLEEALSQVQAVSGATAAEMELLKEAAERGGAATTFSSLEAAQGLGELARATGSAQAAIAALPATLNLAQAAGIGVAESAQFITTTLTQFGLGAEQASRVADVLAKAANSTTADVQGLGNALSYAAPLAKQLGLDTEQTVAIIGALADQGFRGERAGTALRNVFTEMQDPASAFSKALRDLGIESTDFNTVIEQLAKNGAKGQEALLKLDAAARPAILSLVNSGGAALRTLDTDLRNASGAAEETARIMRDNLPGAAEAIKDTFDRTRRSLVEPLLEPLRDELFELSKELEAFAQSPEFDEIKTALRDLFVEGAQAAKDLLENVDFSQLAQDIKTFVGDANTTISDFRENLSTVVLAVQLIGNGFQLVFNVVQAAVLGLVALVAKLVSALAELTDSVQAPVRHLLEFVGILDEGQGSLAEFAGGMNAVAEEFRERFAKNAIEAGDAALALANAGKEAGDKAAAGIDKVADASKRAADASKDLADAAATADQALQQQAAGADAAAASTDKAAAKAAANADRLKKAFADLKLTSQTDLTSAAESAKRNFEIINEAFSSGDATIEDQRRAFAAYAQALRASVADSDAAVKQRVEGELLVRESILGVSNELKDMGATGRNAGREVAEGAQQAASSLSGVASAAGSAASSTADLAQSASAATQFMGTASKQGQQFGLTLFSISEAAAEAYKSISPLSPFFIDEVNAVTRSIREQGEQALKAAEQLNALNAQYDDTAAIKRQLSKRFNMLGDAEITKLAQAYKAQADNQARAADEARRNREETDRQADAARLAAQEQRQLEAKSTGSEDPPIVVELRVAKDPEGGRQMTAQEETESDRLAARVAPKIIRLIERSKNISIRRKTR
jgi:TP901 family phage tail tape measure protein